jgi:hypothetical protein
MLNNYFHIESIKSLSIELTEALINQESFFLENYLQALKTEQYLKITDTVNHLSCELFDLIKDNEQEHLPTIALSHQITLVDNDMDSESLKSALLNALPSITFGETNKKSQIICYISEHEISAVTALINSKNFYCGILSCINMKDKIGRPYIHGLYNWSDAHRLKNKY